MFSGIGGFELGIEKAFHLLQHEIQTKSTDGGHESSNQRNDVHESPCCIGFSEIDKYAIATYLKHFPTHKNYGDARNINPQELPDFDMLCGGFPCQSFSIAGKRLGFEDTRGTLFFDIARIVKVKRPRIVFLENVKGLLNHDNGRTFTTIIATLDELGYNAEWQVLNSKHFGVPQNRERVFIIGHLRGTSSRQVFPLGKGYSKNDNGLEKTPMIIGTTKSDTAEGTNSRSWVHDINGIVGAVNSTEYKQPKQIMVHNMQTRSPDRPSIQKNKNAGGSGHLSKDDGTSYCLDGANTQAIEVQSIQLANKNRGKKPYNPNNREMKFDVNKEDVSYTVKSATHEFMVRTNQKIRRLTPTECERLQGFPDGWTIGSDTQRYKQCGNAVTVNVIEAIVERINSQTPNNKNEVSKQ